jgi:hypothetical protein
VHSPVCSLKKEVPKRFVDFGVVRAVPHLGHDRHMPTRLTQQLAALVSTSQFCLGRIAIPTAAASMLCWCQCLLYPGDSDDTLT